MGIKICPKCGGKVSTSRNVCIHCGYEFPSSKKCPDCGEPLDINVKECPVCGYLFNEVKTIDSSVNINEQHINEDIKPQNQSEVIDNLVEQNNVLESEHSLKKDKNLDNTVNEENESAKVDVLESDSNEIVEDSKDSEGLEIINADDEDDNTSLECPYCHSHNLMTIGIDYYMCETCKGKFLISNAVSNLFISSTPAIENKNANTVLIGSSSVDESHNDAKEETTSPNNVVVESHNDEEVEQKTSVYAKLKETKPKKEKEKKATRSKKKTLIIIVAIIDFLVVVFGILTGTVFVPKSKYDNAMSLLNSNPIEALVIFQNCSWGDSSKQASFAWARIQFINENYHDGIAYMCQNGGTVNVYYNSNGGSYVENETLTSFDSNVTATSSKTGFTFGGWYLTDYEFYNNNYDVDLYLKAKWTINSYTVSVSSSNEYRGTVSGGETYNYGSSVTVTATPKTKCYFDGCSSLGSVSLGNGITTIPRECFYGCKNLQSIIIPSSVTTIEYATFYSSGFTSLFIPKTVAKIENSAFGESKLTTIYCEATSKPNGWEDG